MLNIKEYYTLLGGETEANRVYNVVPYPYTVLKSYVPESSDYIMNLLKYTTQSFRSSNSYISKFFFNNFDEGNYIITETKDYLPSFFSNDGILCFNFSTIPRAKINDVNYLISFFLQGFLLKEATRLAIETNKLDVLSLIISEFFYTVFVKLFRKKQGLAGFDILLKKLKFLVTLYVNVSLFFETYDKKLIDKVSSSMMLDVSDMKLDYNIYDAREFFKCLNDNSILSISSYVFSSEILSKFDLYSIVMFEDVTRFVSVMLTAISIPGSNIFSRRWTEIRPDLNVKLNSYFSTILK